MSDLVLPDEVQLTAPLNSDRTPKYEESAEEAQLIDTLTNGQILGIQEITPLIQTFRNLNEEQRQHVAAEVFGIIKDFWVEAPWIVWIIPMRFWPIEKTFYFHGQALEEGEILADEFDPALEYFLSKVGIMKPDATSIRLQDFRDVVDACVPQLAPEIRAEEMERLTRLQVLLQKYLETLGKLTSSGKQPNVLGGAFIFATIGYIFLKFPAEIPWMVSREELIPLINLLGGPHDPFVQQVLGIVYPITPALTGSKRMLIAPTRHAEA